MERKDYIDAIIQHDENNIRGFFYEYRYLSNHNLNEIEYKKIFYPATENPYQAMKSLDVNIHKLFATYSPAQSKREGRKLKIRKDWELIKTQIMFELNMIKFTTHPKLKEMLLSTGSKYLEETNYWHDNFYGVCHCNLCADKEGKNVLGKTLMNVRSILSGGDEIYSLWDKGIIL